MDSEIALIVRLFVAAVLGAVLGWERERGHKPAGLRTIILVTLGACLFTLVSLEIASRTNPAGVVVDPGRIASGIVTGIGFLGAGAIIRSGGHVGGLTTAATIWTAAAVGMAAGFGFYWQAAVGTILAFVVLRLPKKEENNR